MAVKVIDGVSWRLNTRMKVFVGLERPAQVEEPVLSENVIRKNLLTGYRSNSLFFQKKFPVPRK